MSTYILRRDIRKLPGKVIKAVPKPKPKIIEGYNSRDNIGKICSKEKYKSCLIITDKTIYSLGYHKIIVESLKKYKIKYSIFHNISSEPNIDILKQGKKAVLKCNADCIIALGGGSVMDSSKIIAASAIFSKLNIEMLLQKFLIVPNKTIPLITIPSTAGTGAEVTVGAVVTQKDKLVKESTVIVGLDIKYVILDSELTINLPQSVSASCGIDALSHGLEGVLSDVKVSRLDMQKSMECVKIVFKNLPIVLKNPKNEKSRLFMSKAALYGGYAINNQLAGYVHAFAHSIGAYYHIPHGNAIALSLLPVIKAQKHKCIDKMAELSIYCGFADANDTNEYAANKLYKNLEKLIKNCGLLNKGKFIKPKDIDKLVRMIEADSINYSPPIAFKAKDIKHILEEINKQ